MRKGSLIKRAGTALLLLALLALPGIIHAARSCDSMCWMGAQAIVHEDLEDGKSDSEATQHGSDFYNCCMDACENSHPALCQ